MRIHYIDPGLFHATGHHADWALRAVREWRGQGHEVRVFAHRAVAPDVRSALERHAAVEAVFPIKPYIDRNVLEAVDGELAFCFDTVERLVPVLRGLPPADRWAWPTLASAQLLAIAKAGAPVPVRACVHAVPNPVGRTLDAAQWRLGMRASAGMDVRMGTTAPEIAAAHRQLLGIDLPVLPFPVDTSAADEPRTQLRRAGFIGHALPRKGLHLYPRLCGHLLARGVRVVVQNGSGPPTPGVEFVGHVEDLGALVNRLDLAIAANDPQVYAGQASGIVWQCLAAGVPVVTAAGTIGGRLVEDSGAGTTFTEWSEAGVIAAIEAARARWDEISQAAWRARTDWAARHGVRRWAQALLDLPAQR